VHNIPYNGPMVQKETIVDVFHVKSPLNAGGGGSDIVTSLEGGSRSKAKRRGGPHTLSILAKASFVKRTYRTNM
jgi:hypothetical protein